MRRMLRSALVIARRDYTATVFSRTFLLFLIGPLLPALFMGTFTVMAARDDKPSTPPPVIAIAGTQEGSALLAARARVAARLGQERIPPIKVAAPPADPEALVDSADAPAAVLSGDLSHPVLTGPEARVLAGRMALVVDQARQIMALGEAMPSPVWVRVREAHRAAPPRAERMRGFARGTQTGLFVLIAILGGMLISNLVEEKSNKVIEVLAAAVPVDAIFAGKLIGMLGVSLTGIAGWATMAFAAGAAFLPHGLVPPPAVGWPAFVALAVLYFASLYLLVGAVFLGIGAQAGSVREVQTLSMPLTMAQLLVYGLASAGLANPAGVAGIAAVVLPWSSPYAMLARAAQDPAWWPHPIALAWQLACLAVVIRIAARLFRLTVLKSGGLRLRRT